MVRKYLDSDFNQVASWGGKWGCDYDKSLLPPTGLIIPGVCAYFIYETNSSVCFIENLVRNPDVPKEVADKCVNLLITETLREVKRLGYTKVYATSNNDSAINRAVEHGALASPDYTLLSISFINT